VYLHIVRLSLYAAKQAPNKESADCIDKLVLYGQCTWLSNKQTRYTEMVRRAETK
jgi:hypothetical protein